MPSKSIRAWPSYSSGRENTFDIYRNQIVSLLNPFFYNSDDISGDSNERGIVKSLTRGVCILTRAAFNSSNARYNDDDELWLESLSGSATPAIFIFTKRVSAKALGVEPDQRVVISAVRPVFSAGTDSPPAKNIACEVKSYPSPWAPYYTESSAGGLVEKHAAKGVFGEWFNFDVGNYMYTTTGDDGWINIDPINGEFFTFELAIAITKNKNTLKDMIGFEVKFDPEGDY